MYDSNCDCDNQQKPSLGVALLVSVVPAVLTILFEKAAETVFHHFREKKEKKSHKGEMIEGSDGRLYYLEDGIVFPAILEGVETPADRAESEEKGKCLENGCQECKPPQKKPTPKNKTQTKK